MGDIPKFPGLTGEETLEDLIEIVGKMQKMINWWGAGRISSTNVQEIGGFFVNQTELKSRDGDVGMSSANDADDPVRLWAGSVDKDMAPWRVYKSGKGVATGWKFQATEGGYPNIVFDPEGLMIAAYQDADNYLFISPTFGGTPGLFIASESLTAFQLISDETGSNLSSFARGLSISTVIQGDIVIGPEMGYNVIFPNGFESIYGPGVGSLQDLIDTKATADISTSSAGAHSHGIPDGTVLMVEGGGTVTWSSAGGHTHIQK
ncbi:hypothetical protein J19TS2_30890 [Cohnella xylanilytica]|uniref:hypothetical protein n=1 Tax=Cohnella xylanilytica TaxID=557555 RepID=UPI001B1CA9FB|nr:hypothetical protein [Cohnella xylanilytica]GIO13534.1 hypothetical protein J19TS2_30890 [Cohnella xylanilytica]